MKTLNLNLRSASVVIAFGIAISCYGIASADTIYLGTGVAATSGYNNMPKNVTENVKDDDKNGLADGSDFSSAVNSSGNAIWGDATNTRDKNWAITFANVEQKYYADWLNKNDKTGINAGRSAVEYFIKEQGSAALGYIQDWKDLGDPYFKSNNTGTTGVPADAYGTVHVTSADLLGNVAMGTGLADNFAVGNAGVITSYTNEHWQERGSYEYAADGTVTFIPGTDQDKPQVGFIGVQSGVAAFTTSFTKEAFNEGYNYINGTFAALGEFMGIYINGQLVDANYYTISDDMISSGYDYAGKYDFELNLASVAGLLADGSNNISFMFLSVPMYYTGEYSADNTILKELGFLYFSADINQNTASIFGGGNGGDPGTGGGNTPATPEPATMLIVGLGIAGLGLRKKLMSKK
jgi:hypothetical protein